MQLLFCVCWVRSNKLQEIKKSHSIFLIRHAYDNITMLSMKNILTDWTFISCFSSLSQALLPSDIHSAPSPVYNNCVLIWLTLDLLNNQNCGRQENVFQSFSFASILRFTKRVRKVQCIASSISKLKLKSCSHLKLSCLEYQ